MPRNAGANIHSKFSGEGSPLKSADVAGEAEGTARAKGDKTTEKAIRQVKKRLESSFERERWDDLTAALETVARIGEKHSRIELSLHAQSLMSALETRGLRAGSAPYREVSDRFDALITKLDHLGWMKSN